VGGQTQAPGNVRTIQTSTGAFSHRRWFH